MTGHDLHIDDFSIAFIGFGEAAQAFAKGWNLDASITITAYDIKTSHEDASIRKAKWSDYERCDVTGCASTKNALATANVIFSVVTADQALVAAADVARHISSEALFFDCNSCAPGTKGKAFMHIEESGGRYVDVAVMAPVHPKLHKAPLLISGPQTAPGLKVLEQLNMCATLVDGDVGAASTIKMIRSVMMKGMEALFLECVLAGRKAGVDDTVLKTLDATYPGFDFKSKATYMMERAMLHGVRRAAEMREVVTTLEDLGFSANMTKATVDWEQKIGDMKLVAEGSDYTQLADTILATFFNKEDDA